MKPLLLVTLICLTINTNTVSAAHLIISQDASPRKAFIAFSFTNQIEHSWLRLEGSRGLQSIDTSLGTRIAPDLILTHNHFRQAPASATGETMTLYAADGHGTLSDFSALRRQPLDAGTQLIHLPQSEAVPADCARLADRATIEQLGLGDWLTVVYWDEPHSSLVQAEFLILAADGRTATLFDPFAQINPGDSGGGVYSGGQLVGNTWAIVTLANGTPLRCFNVALLPEAITVANFQ